MNVFVIQVGKSMVELRAKLVEIKVLEPSSFRCFFA